MKYYPNERYGCCQEEMGSSGVLNSKVTAFMSFFRAWSRWVREEKVRVPTPGEAGYAIQLSNETQLDVHPSTEHKMVDRHGLKAQPVFQSLMLITSLTLELSRDISQLL
ncbi:hypothetical protein SO802_020303 [Lithocarpus litseifolius]|uniref:Uncharacterized protein n=1 Tax=Lithocarpus litseifolius TaxID=425828 RepID=A0AAW2CDM2_9ROSI